MAVIIQPAAFAVTEYSFTISFQLDTSNVGYVQYSSESTFTDTDKIRGDTNYGFSYSTASSQKTCVHLVQIDPSIAGPGDIVYYRLRIWNGSSFSTEATHSVRLRRSRSEDTNWSFVVMPNSRDDFSGIGVHDDCTNYYLPTINSLSADFICSPGNMLHDPNSLASGIPASMYQYANLRSDLEQINIPVYLSPGEYDNEDNEDNRFARHAYFPCARLITRGHMCIRTNQDDWQQLESSASSGVTGNLSQGSYYHFTWGNALFIHLNEWLGRNGTGNPDFDDGTFDYQKDWLEAILKEHRHKYKWCFLFSNTSIDTTDPDTNKSIASIGGAGQSYFTDTSTGIHAVYKITAHFHGQYGGWRVTTSSSGTLLVCSTGGQTLGTDDSGNGWHSQHAFAHVNIGMDQDRAPNPNKIKVDIVGVGLGGPEMNEILNTDTSEVGVATAYSGTVLDQNDDPRSISSTHRSHRIIPLGSDWVYNDQNHPVNGDDVDFITGTTKFYRMNFVPQMYSENYSGTAAQIRQLWKISSAPFELNTVIPTLESEYEYIYSNPIQNVTAASPTTIEYVAPPWANKTTLTSINESGTNYTGNPIYYRNTFDIPDDIEPTELELIYNLKDVAYIWVNEELAYHTSGIGVLETTFTPPYGRTRRPHVSESWVDPEGSTPLSTFEPFSTDSAILSRDASRTKSPNFQYESADQPVKIDDPTVINKLRARNNVIAVLVVNGRNQAPDAARRSKRTCFDLALTVHGTEKTTLFAPQITSPEKRTAFNRGEVTITWDTHDPPATDEDINTSSVTYEIEYTDDYKGNDTNWHTVKRRISHGISSYTWTVGKSIKSSKVRIRMRARTNVDDRVSSWSISDEFSVNVFELLAPAIISPLPNVLYSDFILIIMDESLTRNTYHQKVRYTLEYSSRKRDVDWTPIATDIPVGQNVVRWNLDGVQSSDDYILRLTVKNTSTSCINGDSTQPDQISRRFIHDINVQQSGMFLIDTRPPQAILEIEQNTGVTNQLDQIVNIFAEDATSDISNIRLRECDAGSILALGDLEDPYDPLGGCTDLTEVIQDLDKFGKAIPNNPKTRWKFDDSSGLKKIEALLTDIGGNTSLQEQVKVFLSVFNSPSKINDFIIVIEQRDKITIDETQQPPAVIAEPSIFEVVYIVTTDRELWVLEPFARLIWTLDSGIEPVLLSEFNETVYILTYSSTEDEARIYTNNAEEPEILFTFTDAGAAGRNLPTATAIFQNKLYIGMESGALWAYSGLSFSELSLPIAAPISSLFGDNQYLHIGFENSESIVLYNGTDFITLDLE